MAYESKGKTSRSHRGGLWVGMLLVFLGLIFLLSNWVPDWSFCNLVGKFWPVILIIIGLRSLFSYFTYVPPVAAPPASTSPPPAAGASGDNAAVATPPSNS
ncbi:MAG: hypothetical protein HYR55_07915 [Acidobacteria bacterium]|nr:hypothetical protein [Acidobacteriota bacterium]MBI3657867.1 hypothetical protein [Acidobacteriota bacterium]